MNPAFNQGLHGRSTVKRALRALLNANPRMLSELLVRHVRLANAGYQHGVKNISHDVIQRFKHKRLLALVSRIYPLKLHLVITPAAKSRIAL